MNLTTVIVRVGEADTAVDITVYRNTLSAVSPYFRGAFEGSFVENTDRFMSLTDVTEQIFQCQHLSGATVPPPVVLLPESTTKNTGNTTTSPVQRQPPHRPESVAGYTPALDERGGHEKPKDLKEMEGLCHKNSELINRYGLSLLSFLRLYVFADKYNVPQLRDDVLTAMIAQSTAWKWWPDIGRELIESAYANRPPSSKFIRLLVLSTAYCWLLEPETYSATGVRALREMNEDFAFDIMAVQNERLKGMTFWLQDAVPNSCTLHEHLARDAAKCRHRIRDQPYIFAGLVEMCAQDAVSMAKESDEE
ncbi:hypothetical protein J4E91_008571 [Alternaria rosae]|nr:hypothetical protein J4E91_008571 [Alternaria rosae]